jgi:hypothetical protein
VRFICSFSVVARDGAAAERVVPEDGRGSIDEPSRTQFSTEALPRRKGRKHRAKQALVHRLSTAGDNGVEPQKALQIAQICPQAVALRRPGDAAMLAPPKHRRRDDREAWSTRSS